MQEFVIPATEALAFRVLKGYLLRIIEIEGKQVADFNAFNLRNPRERFSASLTRNLNRSLSKVTELYSNPPYENVMFSVTADSVGRHWLGGRCCRSTYRLLDYYRETDVSAHKTCQDNLAEAIALYGLRPEDVHDVFAIFQRVEVDEEHNIRIETPLSKKGDFIELRAEMDCLVAISACPSEKAPTNDYLPKPLGIQIRNG